MNQITQQARDFAALFRGRTDVLGHAKGSTKPISERVEVTEFDYACHLDGVDAGIGIYPMLDDDTVWFGAIDLDEPNFELARVMQKLIPGQSWIERSKSGNAHVWVFFESPAPAWAVRAVLRSATEAVGRKDVEVFPKQDRLRDGGIGNFINLPYHGDERPIYANQYPDGDYFLGVEEFLSRAKRQDPEAWERRARGLGAKPPEERTGGAAFGTQPQLHMCAEHILANRESNPLQPGHRATVLHAVSRQLLNWEGVDVEWARGLVHELNEAGTKPAPEREVDRHFDNALAGEFTSTMCDDPVMEPYIHPDCPIARRG